MKDLYNLTRQIYLKTGETHQGGILGGEFGYGVDFENDTFKIHPFCWCEKEDCGYCSSIGAMPQLLRDVGNVKYNESERLPNFLYKPTGYKLWWYKYIGRGEETSGELPKDWYEKCIASIWEKGDCWYDFPEDRVVELNFNVDDKNAFVRADLSPFSEGKEKCGWSLETIINDIANGAFDETKEYKKAISLNKKYPKLRELVKNRAIEYHKSAMLWHKERMKDLSTSQHPKE